MSASRNQCKDDCIQKLKVDIQEIVKNKIHLTDPETTVQTKIFAIDMLLNKLLEEVITEQQDAARATETEIRRIAQAMMKDEEIAGQVRERLKMLEEIKTLMGKMTLQDNRDLINAMKNKILSNGWDQTISDIDGMGFEDGLGLEIKDLINRIKDFIIMGFEEANKSWDFISNNGYPILCWLMAFLCLLPSYCRDCLRGVLGEDYKFLFDMALSDPSCTYWKAKIAANLVANYRNLTPEQIDRAIWTSFGLTNNVAEICSKICIMLYRSLNSVLGMAERGFYSGLSKFSDAVQLVNINFDIDDAATVRSDSTVYSFKSMGPDDLNSAALVVRVAVPQDHDIETIKQQVLQEINAGVSEAGYDTADDTVYSDEATGLNEGTVSSGHSMGPQSDLQTPDLQTSKNSKQNTSRSTGGPKSSVFTTRRVGKIKPVSNERKNSVLQNPKGASYYSPQSSLSMDGYPNGGRRRKSRRHKKRRSTLKRRRMKRRRTRKGKKRRHTKKR